jgi:BASS family bile acid:Na+ symporter
VIQFTLGRAIGKRWQQPTKPQSECKNKGEYIDPIERSAITAGQAFGQKNTVFIIWMGLVFLNPVTSVVGGFYSIWHNLVNSYQLYKKGKR